MSSDRDDVDRGAPSGESTTDHHHRCLDVLDVRRTDRCTPGRFHICVLGEDDDESGLLSVVVLGDTVDLHIALDMASCLDPKGLAVCDLGDARVGGDGGRRGRARRAGRGGGDVVHVAERGRGGGPGGPLLDGQASACCNFTTRRHVGGTPLGADGRGLVEYHAQCGGRVVVVQSRTVDLDVTVENAPCGNGLRLPCGNGGDGAVLGGRGGGRRTGGGRRGAAAVDGGRGRTIDRGGRGSPFGPGLFDDRGATADAADGLQFGLDGFEGPTGDVRAPGGADVGVSREGDDETCCGVVIVQSGPRARCGARDLNIALDGARLMHETDLVVLHRVLAGIGFGNGRRRGRRGRGGRRGAGRGGGGRDRGPCHLVDGVGMACAFCDNHVNAAAAVECETDVTARIVGYVDTVDYPHTSLVSVSVGCDPVAIGGGPGESDGDSVSSGVCGVMPFGTCPCGKANSYCEHPKRGQNDREGSASRAAALVSCYHYVSFDIFRLVLCCTNDRENGAEFRSRAS